MDIISIIILLGIVQGFFIGLFYITKNSGNLRANKAVGILFLTFSISIMNFFFHRTGMYFKYPHLYEISQPVLFLFGPLFYFYVKLLINKNYKFKKNAWIHFLPFVLCILVMMPIYLKSADEKLKIFHNAMPRLGIVVMFVQIIHLFIYNIVVYKIVEKHKELVKRSESSIEKIDLHWIQNGIICFVGTFSLMLILIILHVIGYNTMEFFQVSIPLIVSAIIYTMGYLGIKQTDIPPVDDEDTEPEPVKKYEKSTLKDDKADEYIQKIKCFMDEFKPYLDNELSLQKLAGMLNIHTHHLSQIINESFNQNFFDFVNSYRIEEAKRLLLNQEKNLFTILAVAEESGFNSKTSFNTAFKKFTGLTPTEFKKKNPVLQQN